MERFAPLKAAEPVTLYYDGECPFCRVEINWLAKHRHHDRVACIDIQRDGFDATELGTTFNAMMGQLHLKDSKGNWYIGMDSSRALYYVLGYRRLVWLSCLPGLRWLMNAGYRLFARHRIKLGQKWEKHRR